MRVTNSDGTEPAGSGIKSLFSEVCRDIAILKTITGMRKAVMVKGMSGDVIVVD